MKNSGDDRPFSNDDDDLKFWQYDGCLRGSRLISFGANVGVSDGMYNVTTTRGVLVLRPVDDGLEIGKKSGKRRDG